MKKNEVLKKKKWLKNRRRVKRIKKQSNYEKKTHKGTSAFSLQMNEMRQAAADAEDKKTKGEMAKAMGINSKEV